MERNYPLTILTMETGALEILKEFEEPTVVAVKHANPCGIGVGKLYLKPMTRPMNRIRCPYLVE